MNARTEPHPSIARLLTPLPQAQAPDRCRHGPAAPRGQHDRARASHLVGKSTRHDLEGPPRKELREPEIFLRILLGAPQDGMRADDKNAPQVAVPLLRDRTELLLAPG